MSTNPVGEEAPKKKKKGKKIALILLVLLLVCGIGVGAYVYSIGAAFDKNTAKFDSAFPSDDGTVDQSKIDEFKKNYVESMKPENFDQLSDEEKAKVLASLQKAAEDAAKGGLQTVDAPDAAALEANKTSKDSDGDGIPDDIEGGKTTARPADTAATDILLLGSDTRGLNNAEGVSGARADTIMVLHIPEDGSAAYLISVMRDTWVNIPGYGSAKVNAALNYGGVDLQVSTIEQILGIHIDHVAEVEFYGFKQIVDKLGGVTVDVPVPFSYADSQNSYNFPGGPQKMDGGTALVFVRQRYAFSDGDYQRVRDQRAFLQAVYNQVKADGALASVPKFKDLVETISPYMTVDNGLSASGIVDIARPVLSNGNTSLHMMTLPNAGTGWSWDGQSIVVLDSAATEDLGNALNANTMDQYMAKYGQD